MNLSEIIPAFYIPVLYGATAAFFTAIFLYFYNLKRAKYPVRFYLAARKSFITAFLPIAIISLYYLFAENKQLLQLNNGWINVLLLSFVFLSATFSSYLEIRRSKNLTS